MNNLIEMNNGKATVSSREVAEKFSKTHDSVLKVVNNLIQEMESDSSILMSEFFIRSTYKTTRNKTYKNVLLTRDGFALAAMGFTGSKAIKWKVKYIEAFNKMEQYIKTESSDLSLVGSINNLSKRLDDLADAGSAWGKTGIEIRKRKQQATEELTVLIDKAQMQLAF